MLARAMGLEPVASRVTGQVCRKIPRGRKTGFVEVCAEPTNRANPTVKLTISGLFGDLP